MALTVLDASVVMGALNARDLHHERAVRAMRERARSRFVLPASAYAELLVHPMRRGPDAAEVADAFLAARRIAIEPVTREIAREAAAIRSRRHSVALPDALVLATGEILRADEILTADASWRRVSERVRVL